MQDQVKDAADAVSAWITYLWVFGIAAWGGAVSYFYKISKHRIKFSLIRFIGELITSAFVGMITFLICDAANISWQLTAAFVGISGHMGTRAIFVMERRYEQFIGGVEDGNSKTRT